MASLVIELQQMAESTATDVPTLLRRAIVVASKLKLDDFKEWFEHELNGYPNDAKVPEYRVVASRLMARNPYHGLIPVMWGGTIKPGQTNMAEHFASARLHESVSKIALLTAPDKAGGELQYTISEPEMAHLLKGNPNFKLMPPVRLLDRPGVAAILDAVRNRILKWSLELEQRGIVGGDMTFTKDEQKAAAQITINGSVGSFVQGDGATVAAVQNSPNAEVKVATGSATISEKLKLAIEALRKLNAPAAEAIEKLADGVTKSTGLPEGKKAEATETLAVIAAQAALPAEQRHQKVVLTSLVSSLRDRLSVSADLLQLWSVFGPPIVAWLSVHL